MTVRINKAEVLEQELARLAVVLADASLEQYTVAVDAVTRAVQSLPDELPDYQPTIYRITEHRHG